MALMRSILAFCLSPIRRWRRKKLAQKVLDAKAAINNWQIDDAEALARKLPEKACKFRLLADIAALNGDARMLHENAVKAFAESPFDVKHVSLIKQAAAQLNLPCDFMASLLATRPETLKTSELLVLLQLLLEEGYLDEFKAAHQSALNRSSLSKKQLERLSILNFRCLYLEEHYEQLSQLGQQLAQMPEGIAKSSAGLVVSSLLQLGRLQAAQAFYTQYINPVAPDSFAPVYYHLVLQSQGPAAAYQLYRLDKSTQSLQKAFPDKFCADVAELAKAPEGEKWLLANYGIGDEIRHAAIYADLAKTVQPLYITCDPRLHSLLRRSYPELEFFPVERWRYESRFGQYPARKAVTGGQLCAMVADSAVWQRLTAASAVGSVISMIGAVWPSDAEFAQARPPALKVDAERVEAFKARLQALNKFGDASGQAGKTRFVGLSWRSFLQSVNRNVHYLSMPEMLKAIQGHEHVRFINLQVALSPEERETFKAANIELVELPELDLKDDFEGMAALMVALDAVVSPATTMIELCGAVGANGYLLSTNYQTAWRKKADGRDIWHQSVTVLSTANREHLPDVLSAAIRALPPRVAANANAVAEPVALAAVTPG
ncbi:MAG: hypothetical protein VKJ06_01570 [Vampirovibrionales bacterium]|nr:hypothetical protein [Vampirovibrionales bacterium]